MRIRMQMLLVASFVLCADAAQAEATPRAESADFAYALDTEVAAPRAVKTAADLAATAPVRKGETVTATTPNGTVSTIVSGAASDGALALSEAFNAGGLWTLSNSRQGSASFTVRHSLYGTLGDGTAASPATLVDGDELVDYNAGDGYVFTLDGGDMLLAALKLPAGVRLVEADGGAWCLVAAANGLRYEWGESVYPIDSMQEGPNRRALRREALPIAYSGDNWLGGSGASTLTVTSPNGSSTVLNLTGTGATPFAFNAPGEWNVSLAMAGGKTLSGILSIVEAAFVIVVR